MITTCRSFLAVLGLSLLAASSALAANNVPLWTVTVPAPSGGATASSLASIISDSLGDSLVILDLTKTSNFGGIPVQTSAGVQILLVSPTGHILGSFESSTLLNATPVFVSSKRVIVMANSQLLQFTPNAQKTLVQTTLPLATANETLVPATPSNFTYKYVDTATTSTQGYVSFVRRYSITKLHP